MNPIVLESVYRSFGARRVLDGFTAKAAPGKVIGLLGRNGEGKTTLFKILLDLLAPDAGRVEMLGRELDGSGEVRQSVGYVPERPAFHPFMSVGEALALRAKLYRNWNAERALELCERLSLDPATRVEGASKGTLGKLAWVCAAAHDPRLYLLDEPTSGLDALVREDVLAGLVSELEGSGRTVLIASHRLDELAGLIDEVWVLAQGRLAAVHELESLRGEARRVIGRPPAGFQAPPGAHALGAQGPLQAWAVLDRAARERLLASGLESPLEEPLPIHEGLKVLLSAHGGDR